MRNRVGQRIGCYLVIEDTGKRTIRDAPVWLAHSAATGTVREVTEHKLCRIGRRRGFGTPAGTRG